MLQMQCSSYAYVSVYDIVQFFCPRGAVTEQALHAGCNPVSDNPCVLTGRDMKPFVEEPRPEVLGSHHQRLSHPPGERHPRAFRDFEAF